MDGAASESKKEKEPAKYPEAGATQAWTGAVDVDSILQSMG